MAYNYFVTRVNALVRNMESAANVVLEAMADAKAGRAPTLQPDGGQDEPTPIAGAR